MERPCVCNRQGTCFLCKLYAKREDYRNLWDGKQAEKVIPVETLPPLATKALNLGAAIGKFVGSGFRMVEESEYEARVKICEGCDKNRNNRCVLCGCSITGRIMAKARWATESCPLKKWEAVA